MKFGRSGGSGMYSYRAYNFGDRQVQVTHLPEDGFKVRIAFSEKGQVAVPIVSVNDLEAELLWNALCDIAVDLKWEREKA